MSQVHRKLNNLPPPSGYRAPPELTVVKPEAEPTTRRFNPRVLVLFGAIVLSLAGSCGFKKYKAMREAAKIITIEQIGEMLDRNDFESAVGPLETYMKAHPNDTTWLINLAYTYKSLKRYDAAELLLKRVLELSPFDAVAH